MEYFISQTKKIGMRNSGWLRTELIEDKTGTHQKNLQFYPIFNCKMERM